MSLPLPNLDDRTYEDIREEAISLIPIEYPEWTDRNPSDPGIILIELLAWLTEMVIYRLDQIPERNTVTFLRLLNRVNEEQDKTKVNNKTLEELINKTLKEVWQPYRAITPEDFEQLVLSNWNKKIGLKTEENWTEIDRVHCLPNRDLEKSDVNTAKAGHISLIIIEKKGSWSLTSAKKNPLEGLKQFLEQRRLLTTHLHIVNPEYVELTICATFYLEDSVDLISVKKNAIREIQSFFNPLDSDKYWDGKGWLFGRSVYISEVYHLLNQLPGVDYVDSITLDKDKNPEKNKILLQPNQLIKLNVDETQLKMMQMVGTKWKEIKPQKSI